MKLSIALKLLERLPTSAAEAVTVAELVARWPDWDDETRPENRRRVMGRWLLDLVDFIDTGKPFVFKIETNPQRWYRSPAAAAALMPLEAAIALMATGQVYDRVLGKNARLGVTEVREALREQMDIRQDSIARVAAAVRILPDGISRLDAQVAPGVMQAAIDAIAQQRKLAFRYTDSRGLESEEVVNPLGLIAKNRACHLVAGDGFHDRVRHFALHRMSQARVELEPLTRPGRFDLDAHVAHLATPSSRWHDLYRDDSVQLELRVRGKAVREFRELPLGPGQWLSETPDAEGWHTLDCLVQPGRQLEAFLLGLGDSVEVVKPAKLRAKIVARIAAIAARYRASPEPKQREWPPTGAC